MECEVRRGREGKREREMKGEGERDRGGRDRGGEGRRERPGLSVIPELRGTNRGPLSDEPLALLANQSFFSPPQEIPLLAASACTHTHTHTHTHAHTHAKKTHAHTQKSLSTPKLQPEYIFSDKK